MHDFKETFIIEIDGNFKRRTEEIAKSSDLKSKLIEKTLRQAQSDLKIDVDARLDSFIGSLERSMQQSSAKTEEQILKSHGPRIA
jgi:hypothetical protein